MFLDQVWDDIKTGEVYANKPDSVAWLAEYGCDVFTAAQLISFADRTHALRASQGQAPAKPVDFTTLGAAMRAIQQAIELIGTPTDERMRAVRRVLRGAVIVAEDDGKVAPLPSTAYAALPTSSHAGRVYEEGFLIGTCPLYTADKMRAFADATHTLRASHGQAPAKTGNSVSAQADSVLEDAARLDWLDQNLFHREKDEWDTKFGGYKEYNMWVLFSPKGIQGRARDIIDAARKQGEQQ